MSQTYNIYCDESGHMENDPEKVMVIGAVRCLLERTRGIAVRVRKIKVHHVTKRKSLIPFPVQRLYRRGTGLHHQLRHQILHGAG